MLQHRHIEAGKMENLGDARIGQQPLEIGRRILAGGELHQMAIAVAARELRQAEPVAQWIETHRLGVDGDRGAEVDAVRQIAFMQ